MTIRTTYAAEAWDKVYSAFQQINFTAYDYDTVKESLLQYLKIYHAEHFNDFIESSELIAILELFAYVAEQLAYRVDTMAHENFITTAQRKQSILRLARLISYQAARNIPARGLVKINSIRTSETVFDSLGNNLSNVTVTWNDPNNTNWKEQFFLVVNKVLTTRFGQPIKAVQVGDVAMQLYTFNNQIASFRNGVFSFIAAGANEQLQMEAVPIDIDENGPFERAPDLNAQFNIVYANDGKGDGSDFTGFMMFVKQGTLIRTDYTILEPTANRRLELEAINVNDTDVWVYKVDDNDVITEVWHEVETLNEQNLQFNDQNGRKKFEVESLENDRIALIFGDGNFSDTPVGNFQIWTRVSANQTIFIPKNRISGQPMGFTYTNQQNNSNTCNITFSLTAAIQNNSQSETIEQIRQSAPSTYYAQNRMVNGQDYNTYMLKDPTILRLKTINRTFAGQPKYIEWNDASRRYENIKLFGDDLIMFSDISVDMIETRLSARTLIDSFIEPLLQTNGVFNSIVHAIATSPDADGIISYPRRSFVEDNQTQYYRLDDTVVAPYGEDHVDWVQSTLVNGGDGSLNEKTAIQGALDQHWYGDVQQYAIINGVRHGIIPDPILNPKDDGKIYQIDLPRTIDGVNTYPPGDVGSGLQQVPPQKIFGLRFNPFIRCFGAGDIFIHDITLTRNHANQLLWNKGEPDEGIGSPLANGLVQFSHKKEVLTIEMTSDGVTFTVISNLRGRLPNFVIGNGERWSDQHGTNLPCDFSIVNDALVPFETGDGFVIDIENSVAMPGVPLFKASVRKIQGLKYKVNFTGWWEIIPASVMEADASDPSDADMIELRPDIGGGALDENGPDLIQMMTFDQSIKANSWIFMIVREDDSGVTTAWKIFSRNTKTIVQSDTTKFWYNQDDQILDSETKKPVVDKIRILRSNLDELGRPLASAHIYDALGLVYDADGIINFNQLEVAPTDTVNFIRSGDATPDNILQFEAFSKDSYQYGIVEEDGASIRWLNCDEENPNYRYRILGGYDIPDYSTIGYDSYVLEFPSNSGLYYEFAPGNYVGRLWPSDSLAESGVTVVRRRMVPAPISPIETNNGTDGCNIDDGLDFMWQHFSPVANLVDPSVTNIHDAFLMTRGYYTSMLEYIKGFSALEPIPPTPLELRTSYGYLLKNKMLSDTVVLHPGKIKLLFGEKADQRLRAKFRVVKSPTATFSEERIKQEIISVIDAFFDIQGWDFGDTFYATELISLIHQRLATQISSVVIVPMYSVNSFGSLFTIESGFDEILQSAATINDIEIVDALTPSVLRQIR